MKKRYFILLLLLLIFYPIIIKCLPIDGTTLLNYLEYENITNIEVKKTSNSRNIYSLTDVEVTRFLDLFADTQFQYASIAHEK